MRWGDRDSRRPTRYLVMCNRVVRMRQGLYESWRPFGLPSGGGKKRPALAQQAVARDPKDGYAWEVPASSLFIQDDLPGALRAWNQVGKPRIDSVRIEGLERTSYALVTEALDLRSSSLLTAESFLRAERRLAQLPDRASARISFAPQSDGFASGDVAIAERPSRPRRRIEWAAAGMQAVLDRELQTHGPRLERTRRFCGPEAGAGGTIARVSRSRSPRLTLARCPASCAWREAGKCKLMDSPAGVRTDRPFDRNARMVVWRSLTGSTAIFGTSSLRARFVNAVRRTASAGAR